MLERVYSAASIDTKSIATFIGVNISTDEYDARKILGQGQYGIKLGSPRDPYIFDCYEAAINTRTCLASMANDPAEGEKGFNKACWVMKNGHATRAMANAHICVNLGVVTLVAGPFIEDDDIINVTKGEIVIFVGDEILWNYGKSFF